MYGDGLGKLISFPVSPRCAAAPGVKGRPQGEPQVLKPEFFQDQAKGKVPVGKRLSSPNSLLSV